MFDQDLGHLCRGRSIHKSGRSDFDIFNNFGASSIFLGCKQILRRRLVLHNQVVSQQRSSLLQPSFAKQTILVLQILHVHMSRLSLVLCIFGALVPTPHS